MRNQKGMFKSKGKNLVEYFKEYAIIWAVDKEGNKKQGYTVDLEDVDRIIEYRWSVDTDGYAKSRSLKMHRIIMNAEKGQIIDHINRDKSDNRKSNLRFVSHSLNMRNTNKTVNALGVRHIVMIGNKYTVQLKCRKQRYHKGGFLTIDDAITYRNELYNKINYFGE